MNFRSLIPASLKKHLFRFKQSRYSRIIFPNWYKTAVGGMWEEMGKLQIDFLVAQGLKPEHYFLDIGCGSLRAGIDISKHMLNAGRTELKKNNLIQMKPTLVLMNNFEFYTLNQKFDYAIAQSVFTHLPLNNIIRCIMNIEKVLVQGGKFYATFNENPEGKFNLEEVKHPHGGVSYFDKDDFHYDFNTFNWICEGTKLKAEYIGNWQHPRSLKMLVFTKN